MSPVITFDQTRGIDLRYDARERPLEVGMVPEFMFNLSIFAGEGGGDAGAGPAVGAGEGAAAPDAANDQRRAAFEKSLEDYKDLYEERFKSQLDRRMKSAAREAENLKGQNARYQALAQSVANRYGLDPGDMDALSKAVDEDESWLEEQAARNGLTVEQQKHMNALEAENQRFKAAREQAERQQRANETLGRWRAEAEELKQVYPDFDLDAEAANPDFADLLGKNVSMRTAYEVVHHDELMTGAMQYAVNRTANAVAASVRANGLRPSQGRSGAAAAVGTDVNALTKSQMEELERRAMRGERITLRE